MGPSLVLYTSAYGIAAGLALWWAAFHLFFAFTKSFRPKRRNP